jgi:hypothetical protein
MALDELQIRRYARHILLPEVGGIGQERLLAAEVRVSGEPTWVDLAAAYLSAAGVACDADSGAGLTIETRGSTLGVVARVELDSILVCASRCPACRGASSGPLLAELGQLVATLAASETLRLILGIGDPDRAWRLWGLTVRPEPSTRCPEHAAR